MQNKVFLWKIFNWKLDIVNQEFNFFKIIIKSLNNSPNFSEHRHINPKKEIFEIFVLKLENFKRCLFPKSLLVAPQIVSLPKFDFNWDSVDSDKFYSISWAIFDASKRKSKKILLVTFLCHLLHDGVSLSTCTSFRQICYVKKEQLAKNNDSSHYSVINWPRAKIQAEKSKKI